MSANVVTIVRGPHDSDHPFLLFSRQTAQNKELSYEALGMLTYLLSKPDNWEVRIDDLVRRVGDKTLAGKQKVYAIIDELVAAGYMTKRSRRQNGQGRWVWTPYRVFEHPCTDSPYTAKPDMVQPDTGKPDISETKGLTINKKNKSENTQQTNKESVVAVPETHSNQVVTTKNNSPPPTNDRSDFAFRQLAALNIPTGRGQQLLDDHGVDHVLAVLEHTSRAKNLRNPAGFVIAELKSDTLGLSAIEPEPVDDITASSYTSLQSLVVNGDLSHIERDDHGPRAPTEQEQALFDAAIETAADYMRSKEWVRDLQLSRVEHRPGKGFCLTLSAPDQETSLHANCANFRSSMLAIMQRAFTGQGGAQLPRDLDIECADTEAREGETTAA